MSLSRQLMASRKDLAPKDIVFRTELEILGALEAWFSGEGIDPSDEKSFSSAGKWMTVQYKGNGWAARIEPSINFPASHKLTMRVLLAAVRISESESLLRLLSEVCPPNPHFSISVIPAQEEEFFIGASTHVSGEPKNMQLAIGMAVNDLISYAGALVQELVAIPGTTILYEES
jgi:hypothetical protein